MSSETLGRALHVVQEVSICRRKYIASVIKSLSMAAGGAVTSIATLFLTDLLVKMTAFASSLILLVLLVVMSHIVYLASKKTFKYTLDVRIIGNEDSNMDLFVALTTFLIIIVIHQKFTNFPQLVLGAPFLMFAIAKILNYRKSEGSLIAGAVLLSLTFISMTLPVARALAALPASYTVSMIVEAISLLSEAEDCGRQNYI